MFVMVAPTQFLDFLGEAFSELSLGSFFFDGPRAFLRFDGRLGWFCRGCFG